MATGIVKWFNDSKGFGFITPDEGDADLFVHASQVKDPPLKEHQRVSFDVVPGAKGQQANNVKLIK